MKPSFVKWLLAFLIFLFAGIQSHFTRAQWQQHSSFHRLEQCAETKAKAISGSLRLKAFRQELCAGNAHSFSSVRRSSHLHHDESEPDDFQIRSDYAKVCVLHHFPSLIHADRDYHAKHIPHARPLGLIENLDYRKYIGFCVFRI